MFERLQAAVLGAILVAFGGCATSRAVPDLPSTLVGERGLLVARFYVLGMQGIENASIQIDGQFKEGALRDGYLAVPLMPGEHTLQKLRALGQLLGSNLVEADRPVRLARGGAPSFIYIPGSTYTIHYTTLDVSRSFRIEPGRVTNLGLIVYLPVPDPPGTKRAFQQESRQFKVFALDNRVEVTRFLETNYADLFRSLQDREIILAPARYFEPAKLPELRKVIAYHESRGPHVIRSESRSIVFGRAGTIVSLTKGATAAAPQIEVLDTGTLADIVAGVRQGERFRFVTSDAELLSWDGATLGRSALPSHVHPAAMASLGDGLLVVDNRLRVLTADQPGGPWTECEALKLGTPRSDLSVASDDEGAFIAVGTDPTPTKLYQIKVGESVPTSIIPPMPDPNKPIKSAFFMVARRAGLYLLYGGDSRFFFRSRATGDWKLHSFPQGSCTDYDLDENGAEMSVRCDGVPYRSVDSGATWSRPEA